MSWSKYVFMGWVIIFCLALVFSAMAMEPSFCNESSKGTHYIDYLYESPNTVSETITDLGGGLYEYSYSFNNVDDKHIWHVAVYTAFAIEEISNVWVGYPGWETLHIADFDANLVDEYDPRQIDPDLVTSVACYGPNWPDTSEPIQPGSYVSGFSYTANFYDSGPKLYIYETVEDGYAGDTGIIAATGMTQQGTVATVVETWGQLKTLFR